MESSKRWTRNDVWLGLLFLAVGILIVVYAVLAMGNDVSFGYWGLGWVAGPLLIFLGGNGVFRSLRSGKDKKPPDSP